MLTALFFICVTLTCYAMSLRKGPFWGLVAYANVYFNNPSPDINWWGEYVPDLRWSLLSAGILLVSLIIHKGRHSSHKLGIFYFVCVFYVIVLIQTNTVAVVPETAQVYSYNMLAYCIVVYLIIKTLATREDIRKFLLVIIALSAYLGIQAYLNGKLLDGRLNMIGPADARGANQVGLMLASIIPFAFPFILFGSRKEKVVCFLSMPFIINGFTLTVSRGALISLFFAIIYCLVLVARTSRKYIIIAVICLLPLFLYVIDENYVDRISSLWSVDIESDVEMNKISSGRMDIWKYGFQMVRDYPFGVGPGGFRALSHMYLPAEDLKFTPGAEYGVKAAHNTLMLVMVELGIFGLVVYCTICSATIYLLFKSARRIKHMGAGGTFEDLMVQGLNMSFACTIFGSLFGSRLYYEFFWWLIAISVVVNAIVKNMETDLGSCGDRSAGTSIENA